jgi:uncharacterized protein YcbX
MSIGTVSNIYRYPVKSMAGESLKSVTVGAGGIPGDRAWAVRDEVKGGIRGGKKIPRLMQLSSHYANPPADSGSSPAVITLPSGETAGTGDRDINQKLSEALEHDVSLWPLLSADLLDHYRRGAPNHEDFEQELREMFARTPDEPLPDLSVFPPELVEFESPPGTYFDAFPILIMSKASLASMQRARPDSAFDVRRFRPNVLLDNTEIDVAFPEQDWEGRRLQIGSVILKAEVICPRCVMTTHGFAELPKDPSIMRSLVSENGGNLGLYASVERPGTISAGDQLTLI